MRALKNNSLLTLYSNGRPTVFRIKSLLGMGGTSVVYSVEYRESNEVTHYGILKEYCPAGTTREEEQLIIEDRESFRKGMENFKASYVKINRYLNENLAAQSFHPYQLAFYEGDTSYMLMTADCGKSYDKVKDDDSLEILLKRMIGVTTAVSHYHQVDMLYLDIKSKNILILDDGRRVKLFDYDSIIELSRLQEGNVTISIPEDFYIPELEAGNLKKISKATDVFALGALFFQRLFGRAPETSEIQRRSTYDFSKAPLLQGVSEKIVKEIEVILKHTLQVAPSFRYQDTSELKLQLEKTLVMVKKEQSVAEICKYLESIGIVPNKKEIEWRMLDYE